MGFFGFMDYSKPGKGISKEDVQKRRFVIFFEVVTRKFWKLIQLSLLYTAASIPALAVYFLVSAFVVPNLLVVSIGEEAALALSNYMFLFSLVSAAFLLLILGSGPATCGAAYVLRNFSREEHSWVLSDFFEHFKKNFKQGMALFMINLLVLAAVAINVLFYANGFDAGMSEIMRTLLISALIIWCVIYAVMQLYIYPMVVTFDLKVTQILKNALLFAIYKLPQNLALITAAALVFGAFVYLGEIFPLFYALIPVFVYSFIMLMQLFYSFEIIRTAMIGEGEENKKEVDRTFDDTL